MNWLSHLFLSKDEIDWQLGNLLADPLKGRAWESAGKNIRAGMALHQSIDQYTDSHPIFRNSKSLLKEKTYLKGVVIDLVYDHFLAKHWGCFSAITLDQFLDDFYRNTYTNANAYPDTVRHFLDKLITADALRSYSNLDQLQQTMARVDRRLSARIAAREKSIDHLPHVLSHIELMETDFLLFFPELMQHVQQQLAGEKPSHWQ